MSARYSVVSWTPFKKRFDLVMITSVALFLTTFIVGTTLGQPPENSLTPIQLVMRATGTLAFLMLSGILCIGPLARLDTRFLPVLYNRRHAGVATFLIGLIHAAMVLLWYHGFSPTNPLISLLISNPNYDSIGQFPFESLGLAALIVLFVMAATSHDFWNANLGPTVWKMLHMGVYGAYGLLVAHIALGVLQSEKSILYVWMLAASVAVVSGLHLLAAFRAEKDGSESPENGYLDAGPVADIPDGRAVILSPDTGERIAVFRSADKVWAVSNVCRHQAGPLGEGRILDGCVTCPWHGFQYDPETGRSPPPFTEKIPTYATSIRDGNVFVDPTPKPPGVASPPSLLDHSRTSTRQDTR